MLELDRLRLVQKCSQEYFCMHAFCSRLFVKNQFVLVVWCKRTRCTPALHIQVQEPPTCKLGPYDDIRRASTQEVMPLCHLISCSASSTWTSELTPWAGAAVAAVLNCSTSLLPLAWCDGQLALTWWCSWCWWRQDWAQFRSCFNFFSIPLVWVDAIKCNWGHQLRVRAPYSTLRIHEPAALHLPWGIDARFFSGTSGDVINFLHHWVSTTGNCQWENCPFFQKVCLFKESVIKNKISSLLEQGC